MKIKRTVTKEMRLDEVIKWAWENNIVDGRINSDNGSWIYFDEDGDLAKVYTVEKTDIFPVETTEEIEVTEITNFKLLVHVYENILTGYIGIVSNEDTSILEITNRNSEIYKPRFIYLVNLDGSIGELIWSSYGGLQ